MSGSAFGWDKGLCPAPPYQKKYSKNNKSNQKLTSTEVQPVIKPRNSRADRNKHQDESQKRKNKTTKVGSKQK